MGRSRPRPERGGCVKLYDATQPRSPWHRRCHGEAGAATARELGQHMLLERDTAAVGEDCMSETVLCTWKRTGGRGTDDHGVAEVHEGAVEQNETGR